MRGKANTGKLPNTTTVSVARSVAHGCAVAGVSPSNCRSFVASDVWGQYADNNEAFKVKLCGAPCAEPCCWIGSMLCWPCGQYKLRYMVLNHQEPGSGWKNYSCCQGLFGGCCCIQPGNLGEESCPQLCMCKCFSLVPIKTRDHLECPGVGTE